MATNFGHLLYMVPMALFGSWILGFMSLVRELDLGYCIDLHLNQFAPPFCISVCLWSILIDMVTSGPVRFSSWITGNISLRKNLNELKKWETGFFPRTNHPEIDYLLVWLLCKYLFRIVNMVPKENSSRRSAINLKARPKLKVSKSFGHHCKCKFHGITNINSM